MDRIDPEHHDGTSDATPGGEHHQRRPGELLFAAVLLAVSLGLMWSAFGIRNPFGPDGLSSPRAIPVGTTVVMVISAALIFWKTARLPRDRAESIARDILPPAVLICVLFLVAYGILLRPLGFLPTSALFLAATYKILARRSWLWTLGMTLGSLLAIWLIFRVVFSVLMPAGIFPEAEIIQIFRDLLSGGA